MNTRNKAKPLEPRKLDVAALVRDAASLDGTWPAAQLTRLSEAAPADAPAAGWPEVQWAVRGESRAARGDEAELWMELQASATVALTCQRCLQAMQVPLQLSHWFRFVRDEAAAAEQDLDSEEEVLVLERSLDLQELVEDELLLALPLVPRHDTCPQPLPLPAEDPQAEAEEERPNPFAVLAALKKK